MKKILLIIGIILVVLIIALGVIGMFYLGPIIKLGIEQVGPQVTQVSIKVDAVDVSPLSGSASIKGLVVGNPSGYSTPQAISVGTVAISLDPLSVTSQKILIHSIHVESPEITFEGGLSQNNLTKILNNVTSYSKSAAPSSNGSSTSTDSGETASKPAPKIEVDDFLITGAKVHINLTGLISKDVSLPDIHLTDLGKGSDGLTPAEITKDVLGAISRDTLSTVASSVSVLGHGVKSLGVTAVKTVGENVSKITSGLGGLLGK